jgi:purine-binding chemotaxis protein CheW
MNGNGQATQYSQSEIGNRQSAIRHSTSGVCNLIAFRLDRQTYALPIESIIKIVEMVTITPIPQVNHSVEGVINFHGAAVPIVNLRRHLGLPATGRQLHTPIVLVQTGERMVGLIVDEVTNVLNVPAEQIVHPAEILPEGLGDSPLLQGLAHTPAGMVLMLDLDHLFLTVGASLPGSILQETELYNPQAEEAMAGEPSRPAASSQETALW